MYTQARTSCRQLGWKVGDLFIVSDCREDEYFSLGQLIQLVHDDNTISPLFTDALGEYPLGVSFGNCPRDLEKFVHFLSITKVDPIVFDVTTLEMYCMLYPSAEIYLRSQYERQNRES